MISVAMAFTGGTGHGCVPGETVPRGKGYSQTPVEEETTDERTAEEVTTNGHE